MTTQQMKYLIAVVEEGSFSGAARRMFVSQPSISQMIKALEKQEGSPLLERNSNPLKLTPVGEAYYEAAVKIESVYRELDNKLAEINQLKVGTLTIGTSPFRASCMLPQSIAHFQKQFPGIKVDIVSDNIEKLKQYLVDGEIDICIENDIFQSQQFVTEGLSTEHFYLAVDPNNPWCKDKQEYILTKDDIVNDSEKLYSAPAIAPSQLERLDFILLDKQSEFFEVSRNVFDKCSINPKVALYSSNIETKFHWINSNLGAGFIPDTMIKFGNFIQHPYYFRIKEPRRSAGMCQKNIVVAYNRMHFLPRIAKEYISQLKMLIGMGTWLVNDKIF
ncbi:MAG: LysR family transcriptional regulator [Eubacterium sp.]|nr:LysR family transcriptional regulator [Eubacterium sp.]